MATLEITETEDFRARAVTAFGGIDRIEFDNTPNLSATFSSDQFGDLSLLFSGISNVVTILGADLIGFTSTMTVFLSGSTVFSAAGWKLLTPLNVNIIGASTNDTLTGSTTGDFIKGKAGNDTLNGGGGGDTLNGGVGADNLSGGSGSDTASYADALAGGGGLGITVVMLNMSLNSGEAFGDVYSSIENITGSAFKDFIAGNASANRLFGLAGDDTLLGQGGNDTLEGGEGNDTLNGQGDADTLKGDIGDDELLGGDGSDTLLGEGGNDTLNGGLGADSLNGADGIDVASYENASSGVSIFMLNTSLNTGEAAGDTYSQIENIVGSNSADTLAGNNVANTLLGGNGADTLIGNGGADSLNGGAGDDNLIGGLGADVLNGGAGAGGGRDTASYVNATAGLLVSLASPELNGGEAAGDSYISIENLAGSGFDDILGGNANANTLSGGNGVDILVGEGGNDTLLGEAGNDSLTGGVGADDLVGGDGNDRFRFLSGSEVITGETIDGGTSSGGFDGLALENTGAINFTVAEIAGVEILDFVNGASVATFRSTQVRSSAIALISGHLVAADTLIVSGATINLSGVTFFDWSLDDTISLVGTAGADTMSGSEENDTFTGGLGSDILVGGNGSDTANYADQLASTFIALADGASSQVFVGGVAQDTIAGIENIIGGSLGDVLFGNSEDNSFFGNEGNDLLRGSVGLDRLDGGAGLSDTADYSDKSTGSILVTLRGANEAQVLLDGTAEDVVLNIENVVGGLGADILNGDARKNVLSGNAGNDTLKGKGGRDTLIGAAGEDVLQGGAKGDTLTGGEESDRFDFDTITDTGTTNATRDVITDFVHDIDEIDLSGIDANSVGGGANDTFSFITSGSFTSPGQIIVVTSGANAIVRVNTDNDSDAEATILLQNVDADLISAGDFIF